MKKLCVLLLMSLSLATYSQNLILKGIVNSYNLKDTGKVYFTPKGKPFDTNQFVIYNRKHEYNFSIPIKTVKENTITSMVFSMDADAKSDDPYGCTQSIQLMAIVQDPTLSKQKSINLKNDLVLDFNCISTILHRASDEGFGAYVGTYEMKTGDTTTRVILRDELNNYYGYRSKLDANQMNSEYGYWRYAESEKQLHIYVHNEMNESFGLILSNRKHYVIKVNEQNGLFTFSTDTGTFQKVSNNTLRY